MTLILPLTKIGDFLFSFTHVYIVENKLLTNVMRDEIFILCIVFVDSVIFILRPNHNVGRMVIVKFTLIAGENAGTVSRSTGPDADHLLILGIAGT